MSVKCFILMSYGKSQKEKEESINTFEEFFKRVGVTLGFAEDEIDRADLSGQSAASLAKNYFDKLANAEIVIADLNRNSSSVYYELGVRHTLVSKKTIIVAPTKAPDGSDFDIAFDVSNDHQVFRYDSSRSIDVIKKEACRLGEEIKKAITASNYVNDSPVFHHIPNMLNYQERAEPEVQQRKIEELKKKNQDLQDEIAKLCKDANELSDIKLEKEMSFPKLIDFEEAEREQKLYGSEIIKSLESLTQIESTEDVEAREKEEKEQREFIDRLKAINDSDFVNASVFKRIARLCHKRKLPAYERRVLETALARYPNDDDIRFKLIDLYHESESAVIRQKAVSLCEAYYCIERQDGVAAFSTESTTRPITFERLVTLFNAYIGVDDYNSLLRVSEDVSKISELEDPRCMALIPRNKAVAEMEFGHYSAAVSLFKNAYKNDPSERTILLLSRTCYKSGKKDVGYLLQEFLVIQDSEEADNYVELVQAIMIYEYLRIGFEEKTGKAIFSSTGFTMRPYEKYIIPILYRAMVCDNCDDIDRANISSFLAGFKTAAAHDALDFFHENDSPQWRKTNYAKRRKESLEQLLDFSIVDYIDEQASKVSSTPGYADQIIDEIFIRIEASDTQDVETEELR